ncbi:4-(cytidine 5'-diphospho)-2-C-methyl-D-erythritol kinase [Corynebacterium cystitidis]|uniref:4-(cytidine 5'-diphospho)-2-C-methyl-D-erythritol kinase n=1 Tax=Corynebacterium cystitidis TaxID=35757 RepID=UPI00211DAA1E|nr:4-(cytidine 5'-diphospho)-2-C-methyl-D-erythritol kinase [Corynebacterium cystitidis]
MSAGNVPTLPMAFTARAYGKVNLHLGVGQARDDGYHDLTTVFQAVNRPETVTVHVSPSFEQADPSQVIESMHTVFNVNEPGEIIDGPSNLAWKAVQAVVDKHQAIFGEHQPSLPKVRITVDKTVFVAGGMAGGSADAAAALVAANEYLDVHGVRGLEEDTLYEIAAHLGADVPFCLMGGTALGTGRGDALAPMMVRGTYWWAFLSQREGLSTPAVFERLDDMRHNDVTLVPRLSTEDIGHALISGDPRDVAKALHNDLQPAALAMHPNLRRTMKHVKELDVLAALVSGSGPTLAVLCDSEEQAQQVVDTLVNTDDAPAYEGFVAHSPSGGAHVITWEAGA